MASPALPPGAILVDPGNMKLPEGASLVSSGHPISGGKTEGINLPSEQWLWEHYGQKGDQGIQPAIERYKNRNFFDKTMDFAQKIGVDPFVKHTEAAIDAAKQGQYAKAGNEGFKAATPIALAALPQALAARPLATVIGVGTGIAGSKATQGLASAAGASPDQAELIGNIGGIATGAAAAGLIPKPKIPVSAPNVFEGDAPAEIPSGRPQGKRDLSQIFPLVKREIAGRVPFVSRVTSIKKPTLREYISALRKQPETEQPTLSASVSETREPFKPFEGDLKVTPEQEATIAKAEGQAQAVPADTGAPSTLPRVASGESVLNNALTSLDNKALLKIARSRGIDVTAEAQLKPGAANGRLIKKIMGDFTPDELAEAEARGAQESLHKAQPAEGVTPEAGKEAWHYKVLQTYFPDVAIPKAMEARAQATIASRPTTPGQAAFLAKREAAIAQNALNLGKPSPVQGMEGIYDFPIMRGGNQIGNARISISGGEARVGAVAPVGYRPGGEPLDLGASGFRDLKAQFEAQNPGVKLKYNPGTATNERIAAREARRNEPQSTTDWSLENMMKQIELNRRAKAGD